MNNSTTPHPEEKHKSQRANWLRAAVLGVNDGIVSTASLMIGVSTAHASSNDIILAGIAGLTAGAMSMAAGEYVSVSSQKDSQRADLEIERRSIAANPKAELEELKDIYVGRGLDAELAEKVARQLHKHNAPEAHLRDELGITEQQKANPLQAALASALAFSIGATVPILGALFSRSTSGVWVIVAVSLLALAVSGAVSAYLGGGHRLRAAMRVLIGGGAAMAVTAIIGHLVGRSL